jgi:hypothetical protein
VNRNVPAHLDESSSLDFLAKKTVASASASVNERPKRTAVVPRRRLPSGSSHAPCPLFRIRLRDVAYSSHVGEHVPRISLSEPEGSFAV